MHLQRGRQRSSDGCMHILECTRTTPVEYKRVVVTRGPGQLDPCDTGVWPGSHGILTLLYTPGRHKGHHTYIYKQRDKNFGSSCLSSVAALRYTPYYGALTEDPFRICPLESSSLRDRCLWPGSTIINAHLKPEPFAQPDRPHEYRQSCPQGRLTQLLLLRKLGLPPSTLMSSRSTVPLKEQFVFDTGD